MKNYDLVLFDCDGTLYDTCTGITTNMRHTLQRLGLHSMPSDFNWRSCVGPPLDFIFGSLLGAPEDMVDRCCTDYRAHYEDTVMPLVQIFEGVDDCLRRLKENGVILGVASSKTRSKLEQTLSKDDCGSLFECVIGPEPSEDGSKCAMILKAVAELNVPKDRVLMIGDTFYDGEGAALAGVDFCAVSWGYAGEGDFEKCPCVYVAQTPAEIADFVLNGCSAD